MKCKADRRKNKVNNVLHEPGNTFTITYQNFLDDYLSVAQFFVSAVRYWKLSLDVCLI